MYSHILLLHSCRNSETGKCFGDKLLLNLNCFFDDLEGGFLFFVDEFVVQHASKVSIGPSSLEMSSLEKVSPCMIPFA